MGKPQAPKKSTMGYEGEDPTKEMSGEIDLERDTQAIPHEDYLRGMKKTLKRKKKKSSTSPREIQEEETNEAGKAFVESERLKNEKKIKRILEGL